MKQNPLGVARVLFLMFGFLAVDFVPADAGAAKRRHPVSSVTPSPSISAEIIDGTPRPRVHPTAQTEVRGSRDRGRLLAPAHEGPQWNLSTVVGESGMLPDLGGDDIIVATYPRIGFGSFPHMEVTNDGTLFIATAAKSTTPPTEYVEIFRSTDGGETWTLWSTFAPADFVNFGDFMIAEGAFNRAFIAYVSDLAGDNQIRIAYADAYSGVPSWTVYTALNPIGVSFVAYRVDLDSDAFEYSDYFVYLLARSDAGTGSALWFARSTNQGTSFSAGTKIAEAEPGLGYDFIYMSVGFGGYVHAAYEVFDVFVSTDHGIRYRRAAGYGSGAWDAEVVLDATGNSVEAHINSLKASPEDGDVVLFYNLDLLSKLRYSTDSGAAWPPGNLHDMDIWIPFYDGVVFPPGRMVVGGLGAVSDPFGRYTRIARSNTGDPGGLAPAETMTIRPFGSVTAKSGALIYDPTRDGRIAAVWEDREGGESVIRFDAEWRRDPGIPNTDIGFPIPVAGAGSTPPAVAEVDGDPEMEIVFATISGDIHVVNHDGTPVPGWPVNIGGVPFDAPVAVGDLVGNGEPYIVSGNSNGQVYAFRPDGTVVPGWPVAMDEVADVFVSIGALGPPNPRYIVALCGHEMRAIRYDGVDVSPLWGTFGDILMRPAAIGDVDNDGVTEIVTLKGSFLHIHNVNDFAAEVFRNFPGEVFSDAPTMADFDMDGTLEIAAPTMNGKMYLVNHDGTDFSASWPITVSPGFRLTAAALADILGGAEIEMAFAEGSGGAVHIRWFNGAEQASYPKASGSSIIYMPPILSPVNISVSNVNIGTVEGVNSKAQSWRNLGMVPVGWPKNLPGAVEETFASGDIDNDGRNELVVLGVGFLTVLDVGVAPANDPRTHWPMYGYDAQRTGCLACEEILTAAGDPPKAAFRTALEARPNPFNPATTIEYEVASEGRVSLEIFDVAGRLVATLIDNEHRAAGRHSTVYNATGASGVYFARLRTVEGELTRKIVLLK